MVEAMQSSPSNIDATIQRDIAALIADEDAAWAKGDAEMLAARALPDVVFTNIIGMFSVGKAPFVGQHAHIFSTIYNGSLLHQRIENIALVTPDVAIVDTLSQLSGFLHVPAGIQPVDGVVQTRLEQVLVRRPDGWWIASFHNVAINHAALQAMKR